MAEFIWLDLETTGLDHKSNRIIEVAVKLTKEDFVPYAEYTAVVYQNPNVGWQGVALEMHQKSGLFNLVLEGKDERVVANELAEFLGTNLSGPASLAGNSVHFDRGFLAEQWPRLMQYLNHRHLDVSSFKILAEARGVKRFSDKKPAHRAVDDINNSFKELEYYMAELAKIPSK